MLKSLSINNSRNSSHIKNRRKKNNSSNKNNNSTNYSSLVPLKKLINNSINAIKIIPRNNTLFYPKDGAYTSLGNTIFNNNKMIKEGSPYKVLALSNNNDKNYRTLEIKSSPNKKSKNNVKQIVYRNKDNNILNEETFLTQNEKKFRRNVSQKIISNQKINNRLLDNIALLKNKIDNNYSELTKSKFNYYNDKKSTVETLIKEKSISLKNLNNHKKIYDLKNEIINIQNQIEEFKKLTKIYSNNYMIINEEINNLKEQNKIIPEIIKTLEIENKNLINNQIIFHSNTQKIKLKIFELEHNRRNIERSIKQTNIIYESNL